MKWLRRAVVGVAVAAVALLLLTAALMSFASNAAGGLRHQQEIAAIVISSGTGSTGGSATTCGAMSNIEATTISPIAKLSPEQLRNAGLIISVAQKMGFDARGQIIGVMVALGEGDLTNLDVGDAAGPDSRGVFQQRSSWGTYAERMDPAISASKFYDALNGVSGWQDMSPTAAAHAVQRNADPGYYTQFLSEATQIVASAIGAPAFDSTPCAQDQAPIGGFALPLPRDALNANYVSKPHHDHPGADLPAPTGTPISAVEGGVVTVAGPMSGYGNNFVAVVDGQGWTWYYGHGSAHSVSVGDSVQPGQIIAQVGNEGFSTGPHLHLGLNAPGQSVPTGSPSYCPQGVLMALWDGKPAPALTSLSTTACIGSHL